MAAYTRQSSFSDGDTISASLFNNEYDALAAAFVNTSGHKHDGTTGEGPVIGVLGDASVAVPLNKILIDSSNDHLEFYVDVSSSSVQQLYIADGLIAPVTDSDVDLGTSSLYFKNAFIDSITTTGNVAVGGNLTVTGSTANLFTSNSYNVLELRADENNDGGNDDTLFKMTHDGTFRAGIRFDESENQLEISSVEGANHFCIGSTGDIKILKNVGIQTNDVTRTNLVGAGSSLVGMYIGDGSILFNKTLNRISEKIK